MRAPKLEKIRVLLLRDRSDQKKFIRNMSKLIAIKENMKSDVSLQIEHRQEPTTLFESKIDSERSDEKSHQLIETVETENPVDDLL